MNSIGLYIRAYPRSDGRVRLRFEPRVRPDGWPSSRPLYLEGEDYVDLDNLTPEQEAELQRQAKNHYIDFNAFKAKAASIAVAEPVTDLWDEVIAIRKDSENWRRLAERTQESYSHIHRQLVSTCRRLGLSLETTRESQFELALRDAFTSEWTRKLVYSELHVLVDHARVEGLRGKHLKFRPKVRPPEVELQLWEEGDLHALVRSALHHNEVSLARLMIFQWEVGQRLTSARNFRYGHQYRDSMVIHRCRKTRREVRIPILNPTARTLLDRDFRYGEYMFVRKQDGEPYTERNLSQAFARLRKRTPGYEDSELTIRTLRHTCILQLARSGCYVHEIASVTGHALSWVYETLESYLGRDTYLSHIAMAKREKMRMDGIEGEVILQPERRIFFGPVDPATKPLTPKELSLYGG